MNYQYKISLNIRYFVLKMGVKKMKLNRLLAKNIFGFTMVTVFAFACTQKPNFPLEPSIELAGITKNRVEDKLSSTPNNKVFRDSVSISINFRDGNGDLGVNEAEKTKLTEKGEYNYIVKRFVRVKGKYVLFDPIPSHSGNFITLKSGSKAGPIEGTLNYAIEFSPFTSLKNDTIKFEIQIVDRAKNLSNTVMTDSVLVYELNKSSLPK